MQNQETTAMFYVLVLQSPAGATLFNDTCHLSPHNLLACACFLKEQKLRVISVSLVFCSIPWAKVRENWPSQMANVIGFDLRV